ncbi:malonyl-ACP O-methyltransferase BioC [Pelotalea chapellei]|uniref:Malonyl-[acyl-carrier protein] O-methyltransferase n=1 Tax=Pelotalea chapellei TaxID=44671 RepID=A0ABS5U7U3_9BACT|nr:malonyl-ACP O-methyltransferase BioC [Pelotalea chapellei]
MTVAATRNRIGKAFHRQAGQYDQHAVVQKRVVQHLERLIQAHLEISPKRLLDIGCGTGNLLALLQKRFPLSRLHGLDLAFNMALSSSNKIGSDALIVNGDAEQLPYRDSSFELVVSASTLQWIGDLDACLKECFRVLVPGGLFCAAFFGGNTLWELQESYRQALGNCALSDGRLRRLQHFKKLEEVHAALLATDFEQAVVASETEMEYHPDVSHLLRSIKGVGAATAAVNDSGGGLGWRGFLHNMQRIYSSRFQDDGKIPATYEVFYIIARRPQSPLGSNDPFFQERKSSSLK